MLVTAKQIDEMAQEIEAGMKIYINRETYEIKPIFDWEESFGDTEEWEEEQEAIEADWADFIVVTKMESREAFRVMEDFLGEVQDEELRQDLVRILERKRPFANFKAIVESSAFRENWFDFRTKATQNHIKEQLKSERIEIENGSTSS